MTSRRRNGFFPSLQSSFPELFNTEGGLFESPFYKRSWQPAVNIRENDDHFEIDLAAPGLSREDFNVSVEDGVLTISCEKEEEKNEEKEEYTSREFSYQSFRRAFSLPESVDQENIKAQYTEGILKITLQKDPEAHKEKTKKIEIS